MPPPFLCPSCPSCPWNFAARAAAALACGARSPRARNAARNAANSARRASAVSRGLAVIASDRSSSSAAATVARQRGHRAGANGGRRGAQEPRQRLGRHGHHRRAEDVLGHQLERGVRDQRPLDGAGARGIGPAHGVQHVGLLGRRALLDQLDGEIDVARLARVQVRQLDRPRPQRRGDVHQVLARKRLRRRDRGRQRRPLVGGAGLEVGGAQVRRRVAQGRRADAGRLRLQQRGQTGRRDPQQEREFLFDRIVAPHHPVLQDASVQAFRHVARIGRARGGHQQRGRLAQRRRAGRIAPQILDDARADQLDRGGHGLDLIFQQQLAHHAAGQHPVLAQRAPDLGQVVDGRRGAGLAVGGAAAGPRPGGGGAFRFAPARGGQRRHQSEDEGAHQQAQHGQPDRERPGDAARRGRLGGGRRRGAAARRRLPRVRGLRLGLRRRRIRVGERLARGLRLRARRRKRDHAVGHFDRHVQRVEPGLDQVLQVLAELGRQLAVQHQRDLDPLGDELGPGRQILESRRRARRQRGRPVHADVDVLQLGLSGRHLFQHRRDPPLHVLAHAALQQRGVVAERRAPLGVRHRRRQHRQQRQRGPQPMTCLALHVPAPSAPG